MIFIPIGFLFAAAVITAFGLLYADEIRVGAGHAAPRFFGLTVGAWLDALLAAVASIVLAAAVYVFLVGIAG